MPSFVKRNVILKYENLLPTSKNRINTGWSIQSVPGGMYNTSGGCSLC
jgi:hypothetical protein